MSPTIDEIQSDLMTLPQCAKRLGLSWYKTWDLVQKGELNAVQIAGRWYVAVDDLEATAARQQQKAPTIKLARDLTSAKRFHARLERALSALASSAGRFTGLIMAAIPPGAKPEVEEGIAAGTMRFETQVHWAGGIEFIFVDLVDLKSGERKRLMETEAPTAEEDAAARREVMAIRKKGKAARKAAEN